MAGLYPGHMSNLEPARRRRMTRSQRVSRTYNLVVATAVSAIATILLLVLAVIGVVGAGWLFIALVATVGFGYGSYRSLKP